MDLVRDFLDKAVLDRNGREMGRVDGVVLRLAAGAQPRIEAIEIGLSVLGSRLGPLLGRWAAALEHALGIDEGRPLRIEMNQVLGIDDKAKVDLAFSETSAANAEQRLRRIVSAIPRSS
jgi:sporulation protein YlmC with PRC-barrel domain